MPQCSDMGPGWTGDYPNCTYETPDFTGTVPSLGYTQMLPVGEDWAKYFDPYDPTREQMATTGAGIDIGQLQSAWDLQQQQLGESYGLSTEQLGEAYGLQTEQLGETWGVQKEALGTRARRGVRQTKRAGTETRRKVGGIATIEQADVMQRTAEADVMTEYRGGMRAGETAYQQALGTAELGYEQTLETVELGYGQALETGQLALTQGTTDIYQDLGEDIYGYQYDWMKEQRDTLNVLFGLDVGELPDVDSQTVILTQAQLDAGMDCSHLGMQTCDNGECAWSDMDCGGG